MTLAWTSEPPAKPGLYWLQQWDELAEECGAWQAPTVVRLLEGQASGEPCLFVQHLGGRITRYAYDELYTRWAGPMIPPDGLQDAPPPPRKV